MKGLPRRRGFTLIEVLIVVAMVAILAAIATPVYSDYVRRGEVAEAFNALADYRARMEQYYQDNRNYGSAATCAADATAGTWNGFIPAGAKYFTYACTMDTGGDAAAQQSYTITATGSTGLAMGHVYTINQNGERATTLFKGLSVSAGCWLTRDVQC